MQKIFCFNSIIAFFVSFLVISCAGTPPKKEYAQAKMALMAASEAQAQIHAPVDFDKAEQYMKLCDRAFYERIFSKAREYALLAKQFAEAAELKALEKKKQSDLTIQSP